MIGPCRRTSAMRGLSTQFSIALAAPLPRTASVLHRIGRSPRHRQYQEGLRSLRERRHPTVNLVHRWIINTDRAGFFMVDRMCRKGPLLLGRAVS